LEFGRYISDAYPLIGGLNDIMWRKGGGFTPAEIRAHYLHGTVPGGLTDHWPCREGAGTNLANLVSARVGTLSAASWTTDTRSKARIVSAVRSEA
jgi:hypothetical protein